MTPFLRITAIVERWPVAGEFVIARGAKTHVDVLLVAIACGGHIGMAEATAIYYHNETAERCLGQVEHIARSLEMMEPKQARLAVQEMLDAGAARNALDCALWDLEAKLADIPLWQYAGFVSAPKNLETAFTISLGDAPQMEADAARAADAGYRLLKLKLTGQGDRDRVRAVHNGAPDARLIVDANESWAELDIAAEAEYLSQYGVEMIEQPLAPNKQSMLADQKYNVPLIADESCQTAANIPNLVEFYDGINIKLDKAGGLTEAINMAKMAREYDMKIMVGCMLSTSLGIAPAFLLAQNADWVDLDGPALLAEDRDDSFTFGDGHIHAPDN